MSPLVRAKFVVADAFLDALATAHEAIARLGGKSEEELHHELTTLAASSMQHHDDMCSGILFAVLQNHDKAAQRLRLLSPVVRDNYKCLCDRVHVLLHDKWPQLTDAVQLQVVFVVVCPMKHPLTPTLHCSQTYRARWCDCRPPTQND